MKRCLILFISTLAAAPASAGETSWQAVMPEVLVRLVAADGLTDDGTSWIALEIDMPPTMKTYWRVPGESGIPPRFDFSGSAGIAGHEVAWPYPTRSQTGAYLDHAYYGHTVLPIEVRVTGDAPVVALNVVLGICSDICVPVSADFSLAIDTDEPDRANTLRVHQALASVPIPWEGDAPIGAVRFESAQGGLIADLVAADFPARSAIADIAGRPLLFGPPEPGADGDTLRFPLLGKAVTAPAAGEPVHITFMGVDGPYEIVRPLSP